ncbi:hypothetical protein E2C01_092594 [Portunus trituberculatus]|uniref:Uncharacterized protein n=1 Tax=Portunus trituberculatus TaxID=210409 RepID=A0A5B7JQY9_PORTR|nr:hypothetical protein [Portunus trituberculatus]
MSRELCFFRSLRLEAPPRPNIQTAENSLDSKDWPLLCCPGFTLYLLPGVVNESVSSVGETPVLVRLVFLWPSLRLEGDSW